MMVTRNFVLENLSFTSVGCVRKGSTASLNHFEVRINESRVEVYGSDPGGANLHLLAYADVAMPLTRGVIWIEDMHYNADKFNGQADHTFAWDNVGFDGPAPYRDLTFDVPDALDGSGNQTNLGYEVGPTPKSLTVHGVTWLQTPTKSYVAFNWQPADNRRIVPSVRVNGGPWHDSTLPAESTEWGWRTIAVPIPFNEIHAGDNTIEFQTPDRIVVANINIILIAAAPVP